ncbi:unnamed protein product, partial [Closterium sp. NIES-54]
MHLPLRHAVLLLSVQAGQVVDDSFAVDELGEVLPQELASAVGAEHHHRLLGLPLHDHQPLLEHVQDVALLDDRPHPFVARLAVLQQKEVVAAILGGHPEWPHRSMCTMARASSASKPLSGKAGGDIVLRRALNVSMPTFASLACHLGSIDFVADAIVRRATTSVDFDDNFVEQ